MAEEKRYSAFISSNFVSLQEERRAVFRCLLDMQIFPFGMEYFTASSSENFKYITRMIDQSDIFIMLLGDVYGSCDDEGVSWTQREYEYARASASKLIFVFLTQGYLGLRERARTGSVSEDERRLLSFGDAIPFAKEVSDDSLVRVVQQSIRGIDYSSLAGWVRNNPDDERAWQDSHRRLDLAGRWYHVHLKEDEDDYIRVGTVTISQEFNRHDFETLEVTAENYNVKSYNPQTDEIVYNHLKRTKWTADYRLSEDGSIKGIYSTKREFREDYGEWRVERGTYVGVHELDIVSEDSDIEGSGRTTMIQGVFKDCTPSQKEGLLYLFRNQDDRLAFLKDNYADVLASKQI